MQDLTMPADFRCEIKEIQETDSSKTENIKFQKKRLAERFLAKINPDSEPNYNVLTPKKVDEVFNLLQSLYEC